VRVFFASDLHVDVRAGLAASARLASWTCQNATADDVLVLGGDYGNRDAPIRQCLELFAGFPGPKLALTGNHDVWAKAPAPGSSNARLEHLLDLFEGAGFHALERAPYRHGGVGFVGVMGWYDFSFREPSMNVPLEVYHAKGMPGLAGTVWADGDYVDWGVTDPQFTNAQVRALSAQFDAVSDLETVYAFTHHVPVVELLRPRDLPPGKHRRDVVPAKWLILNTYLGSDRLGHAILEHADRVALALCGHIHLARAVTREGVEFVSNGSSYEDKELIVVEGSSWSRRTFWADGPGGEAGGANRPT
jgi:hypothetical protein